MKPDITKHEKHENLKQNNKREREWEITKMKWKIKLLYNLFIWL